MSVCLDFGSFPVWFKHSVVKAIPKPNASDQGDAKSWRPISLLSVPGKVLERLMIDRVMYDLHSRNLLSPNQFGFTRNRSTIDAIKRVVDRMQNVLDSNYVGAMVSLDVTGAFDNAGWPCILHQLKRFSIPHNLFHLCEDYFNNRSAEICIDGSIAFKTVSRGCPQEFACGPSFWNILYDQLLQLQLADNCELIAFADDVVLLSWARKTELFQMQVNPPLSK